MAIKLFSADNALLPDDIENLRKGVVSPIIFSMFENTVILTHGNEKGELKHKDSIKDFISFFPEEKFIIVCCYPNRVRANNPDLARYIIPCNVDTTITVYWDNENGNVSLFYNEEESMQ